MDYLRLIPKYPTHIPDSEKQSLLQSYQWSIFPEADSIELKISLETTFIDPDSNLESIHSRSAQHQSTKIGGKRPWTELIITNSGICQSLCHSTLNKLKSHWPAGLCFVDDFRQPVTYLFGKVNIFVQ